jgi:hypothetical protein
VLGEKAFALADVLEGVQVQLDKLDELGVGSVERAPVRRSSELKTAAEPATTFTLEGQRQDDEASRQLGSLAILAGMHRWTLALSARPALLRSARRTLRQNSLSVRDRC